jgi:hypothetical protein
MRAVSQAILAVLVVSCLGMTAQAANAPTNLTAAGASSSQINLNWTDNASDETGFTFAFDTNSALSNPTYVYAGGVNTTSYAHTGRAAATTYYYKIKAEGNPDSTWTSVVGGTTAPTGFSATAASNSSINLNWTANGSNSAIIGYTYAYATNSSFTGATYVYVNGNGSSSTSRSGLATATTYWVKIKAEGTSDALDSPFGSVVTTTTMPASLTATPVSSSQIDLSWTGNAGNTNIVGYTIATANNSSFTGATYRYVNGASATTFSDTGLVSGTTYYYKIKAEGTSDAYDSAFSGAISASPTSNPPNAPSGLTASVVSTSQINLSWTDNSTNETGFEVKRATDSAFTANVSWVGNIQGTTYSATGLTAGTTYYFKVRAQGTTQDSAYSTAVSAATLSSDPIPAAPSNLSATALSNTQVSLTWTDNSSNETGFEVKRATDSAFTTDVVWVGSIQGTSYSDGGLTAGTTYYYKVRAEGTAGKSAYSSAVNVTTGGSAPPAGTPISSHFFGINAWMPEQIGDKNYGGILVTDQNAPIWTTIQNSGVKIMRYGGHGVDAHANPDSASVRAEYAAMIDAMRVKGITPVMQVPVLGGYWTSTQAANLVRYINYANGVSGTHSDRWVKYWVIGNEPNLHDTGYGENGYTASQIADYIIDFSIAMKTADPQIKIIGPELAWYDDDIMTALTTPGGDYDITGADPSTGYNYVDIVTFHIYPFDTYQTDRGEVINKLTTPDTGFKARLAELRGRLDSCNSSHSRSGDNALKMAVTEANIDYVPYPLTEDNNMTLGAKSFMGGQFWAEMLGISMFEGADFITFWSVAEGSGLGYLSSDGNTKRSTYHHFQMMAQNFRGNAVDAWDDHTNVKTFGAVDSDQIAVVIMNQETGTSYDYTVRLASGTVTGTRTLKIRIPADVTGANIEYNSTTNIAPESTVVLVFDRSGVLTKKTVYTSTSSAPVTTYP